MNAPRAIAVSLATAAFAVSLTACELPAGLAESAPAAPADLAALPIATEDTGAHYDRDDWPHWSQVADGCDTRETVLRAEGREVTTGGSCAITGGEWTSVYDGQTITSARSLDVDHIVPLAEVQRSGRVENGRRVGPRQWSREDRRRYANDPEVLVAVSAKSNRSKGDQDPAKWLPDLDRCGYARDWVRVKAKYALSADQAEHDALASVLAVC
ncbi:HNH endonuclease family protein [Amycolatopsis antarctica]|uniref:HNH endonuclease family protein n=1 Tax=Amycolatopsis antarctica TaxID=1854586 RepID=UPI001F0B2E36|nr:HNH endonuclease family protein [Amycolatopsis antarctica]